LASFAVAMCLLQRITTLTATRNVSFVTTVADKPPPSGSKSSSTRTKTKQANANPLLLNRDFEDVPHVVFEELHFRRVCEEISSSVLCLTIRYPFQAPLQNASRSFPSPVDKRFYKIDRLFILDGAELDEYCRRKEHVVNESTTTTIDMDVRVRSCLDDYATKQHETFKSVAVAVFTRRTMVRDKGGAVDAVKNDFYGTGSELQMHRARQFFNNQVILVLGDSIGPHVTECLVKLLGNCKKQLKGHRYSCVSNEENTTTTSTFEVLRYMPQPLQKVAGSPMFHDVNSTENLTTLIRNQVAKPQWKSIQQKEISILVEFPIAHSQVEPMLFHNMAKVEYNQVGYTQRVMSALTSQGRRELNDINITLARIAAFDGLPQHFPTETGSYQTMNASNQREFLARNGSYSDWRPEYGSNCVGPLPPTNPQKRVNGFARTAFEELGFDTNFYGKTWEFTNLFWFQTRRWVMGKGGGLIDCTHHDGGRSESGAYCMHKFFLQAMIDSHFETESMGSL
jgi:hypothetical protein